MTDDMIQRMKKKQKKKKLIPIKIEDLETW